MSTPRINELPAGDDVYYSRDGERYNTNDLDELIDECGLVAGDVVFVGRQRQPSASDYTGGAADIVIDAMGELAWEDGGEFAEDFPAVTDEAKAKLGKLIDDWSVEHCKVGFFLVDKPCEYVLTQADIDSATSEKDGA